MKINSEGCVPKEEGEELVWLLKNSQEPVKFLNTLLQCAYVTGSLAGAKNLADRITKGLDERKNNDRQSTA